MDFAAGVYLSAAPSPLMTPYCIRVYSIHIHTGKGGEMSQREGYIGATVRKAGSKISI